MRRHGKFEKGSSGTRSTAPHTTGMMLQSYFTSLLSLLVCVAMFFGTSYAWFTSEVTNTGNEIYIGVLDVGLLKVEGETKLDLATTENNSTKLFDKNIRWEPGYTSLETIQVVNKGDLAFNYVMSFLDGALLDSSANPNDGISLGDVASYFEVWVYTHDENGAPNPGSYEAIKTNDKWKYVGTLGAVLDGEIVLAGTMEEVRQESLKNPNVGTTDGVATTHTYTIAVHMKEVATDVLGGKRIGLNVKLIAYQKGAEVDGFGNSSYDNYNEKLAVASDVVTLKNALNNNVSQVLLASSVNIQNTDDRLTMNGGSLEGNGNTITYNGARINNGSVGVVTTSGGTINNLKINGGDNGRALYVTKLESNLKVTNCTFSGAYSFNLNSSANAAGRKIEFENTTFNNWTSYANVADSVNFTKCTFNGVLKPYGNTLLEECIVVVKDGDTTGLYLDGLESGETITLLNCTYNNVLIKEAEITNDNGTIKITDNSLLSLLGSKMVVPVGNG